MSIWPIPAAPGAEAALEAWRVFELQLPGEGATLRHLFGRAAGGEGRVTSPVLCFDWSQDLATTRSGRVYRLGKPGFNEHATFAFERWLQARGLTQDAVRDVTHDVLAERQAARAALS